VAAVRPSTPAGHYRPDIDGLRAIAVLSVVGFHASPHTLRGGFTGVDVFFVISGFLISGILFEDLRRGRFSFRRFYARRFRRIFPALLVVLAACLAYGAVALAPDEFRELGEQAAAGAGFCSNILQWMQAGYFDQKATLKPLLHLWSLGVEEQFYIVWPVILLLAYRRARLFPVVCGALIAVSFAVNLIETATHPSAAFYLPLPRFWELLVGAVLAYRLVPAQPGGATFQGAASDGPGGRVAEWCALLGLAAIVLGFFAIDADRSFPGAWALLPTLGTALVISAPSAWVNRRLLSARPLVLVGLISYPLYLWHWVLLTFLRLANFGEEPALPSRAAAIGASAVLAWLTYRWVERPIRFSGRRDALPRALIASMSVCALAGVVVYVTDGLAFRYPAEIRPLAAFEYDSQRDLYERLYRGGECWLSTNETFADLSRACVDAGADSTPLIALWGDSHAASLYPGLRAAQKHSAFRLAQYTASACPPIVGLSSMRRPNCRSFNDSVVRELSVLKPQVVLLEAHWALYNGENGQPQVDAEALHRTIEELGAMGIRRIVVLGSLPTWKMVQSRVVFEIWRREHVLKDRTSEYLEPEPFAADQRVRAAVMGTPAMFISPLDLLCHDGVCLISTDPHAVAPLAWDNDHLSLAGSEFLAERVLTPILGSLTQLVASPAGD
jgi:peptidoglycan/LPS O-acetylase OafA/YrhL